MTRGRPAFSTSVSSDGSSHSRSPSRSPPKSNLASSLAGHGGSPARPSNAISASNPGTPHVSIPADITEEPEDLDLEAGSLLFRAPSSSYKPSRPWRVGSLYGTFDGSRRTGDSPGPRYIQLAENNGEPLRRNQSVFKMAGLIDDREGDFEVYRMDEEELGQVSKKARAFYEHQNEILDAFAEVDEVLESTRVLAATGELAPLRPEKPSAAKAEAFQKQVKWAININFAVNFVLLAGKIIIVLLSNSMSLIASTVDSAMDFLSTMIIFGTSKIIENQDWRARYNYPTGKRRMEPMSVVVFAVFMIASFLQVLIESIQRLLDKELAPAEISLIGKAIMASTIVIKLVMWYGCKNVKNTSVQALAQDAENDIVFNFFSLLFPFVGELLHWKYLDPLGGALLSIYIIVEWTETLLDNIKKLTGRRASPLDHQRVCYLLTRFSPLITHVQHLAVYHTGDAILVETDIVVPSTTDLTMAHNVGESAQYAIEQLDGVERAFVHVDCTVNAWSGHVER